MSRPIRVMLALALALVVLTFAMRYVGFGLWFIPYGVGVVMILGTAWSRSGEVDR